MSSSTLNFKALNSLRFIAAVSIVIYHFKTKLFVYNIDDYTGIFRLPIIVDFFLVLSGFVLAHVYTEKIHDNTFSNTDFLLKRLVRIYPLHLLTFVAYFVLDYLFKVMDIAPNNPQRYDKSTIPAILTMTHAWGFTDDLTYNFPSWTISAEWLGYLLFLPLMLFIRYLNRLNLTLLLTGMTYATCYFVAPLLFGRDLTRLTYDFGILRMFPEFLLGICLYMIYQKYPMNGSLVKPVNYATLVLIALCLHFGIKDIVILILYSVLIVSSAEITRNGLRSFLNNRVLYGLGDMSYSMYMTHALVQTLYFNGIMIAGGGLYDQYQLVFWLAAIPIAILVAYSTHRFIETPLRNRSYALLGRSSR